MTNEITWTEDDVQRLLQHPDQLLDNAAWRQAISSAGGIETFYGQLRTFPLKEKQQALLDILTTYPGASVDVYCNLLHVHPATFHRHQRTLFRSLATFLNTLDPAQSGQPAAQAPRSTRPLHQLRAPVADFVGREDETSRLLAALRAGAAGIPAPPLGAIHGMGGVGKTELAARVAQQLIGDYPDAQILVSLHGTRETPLTPVQALQSIIQVLTRENALPTDLEALEALYRSCLHGKRVLLLLDDARDPAHVYPCIPPPGNALLVTSRQRFVIPGMVHVHLEDLPAEQAPALLRRICPRLDSQEAAALALACGTLPLALRTSASILANNPALPVESYLRRLSDTRKRLTVLRDPDDTRLSVESSLDLSYATLDPPAAQALRQLSVIVADFTTPLALAVIAGQPEDEAEEALYTLLRRNLLLYDPVRGRWRLHDLVRSLGLARAEAAGDLQAASFRYAQAAITLAGSIRERVFLGSEAALAAMVDFDQERAHIDVAWEWALSHAGTADGDRTLIAWAKATSNTGNLRYANKTERYPQLSAALDAAIRLGDRASEGELRWRRAVIDMYLGNIELTHAGCLAALDCLASTDDQRLLTDIRTDLATTYFFRGGRDNMLRACELFEQALASYRSLGASQGRESLCLNNMSVLHTRLGDLHRALTCSKEALMIARQCAQPMDECRGLASMADIYINLGDAAAAVSHAQQAIEIARSLKHRQAEGIITSYLAAAYALEGNAELARDHFEQALEIVGEVNDRWQESDIRWKFGLWLARQGQRERALELLRASLAYKAEINQPDLEQDRAALAALEAQE